MKIGGELKGSERERLRVGERSSGMVKEKLKGS